MKFIVFLWILVALVACQSSTGSDKTTEPTSIASSDQSGSKEESKSGDKGSDSSDAKSSDKSGASKDSEQSGGKETKNKTSNKRDPFNDPRIVMYEPIYIETIKKSSIPIDRPCTFRWRLEGKANKDPESFTLTLLERRGYDVTYVIEENISVSDTSYVWDLPKYRPSENNDEAITLKPGGVYKMILHDSAVKYNAAYPSKERYLLSAREFTLYTPSDPNSVFSAASIPQASSLLGIAMLFFL